MSDGKYVVESEFAAAVALWSRKVCIAVEQPELHMRLDLSQLLPAATAH